MNFNKCSFCVYRYTYACEICPEPAWRGDRSKTAAHHESHPYPPPSAAQECKLTWMSWSLHQPTVPPSLTPLCLHLCNGVIRVMACCRVLSGVVDSTGCMLILHPCAGNFLWWCTQTLYVLAHWLCNGFWRGSSAGHSKLDSISISFVSISWQISVMMDSHLVCSRSQVV